MKRFLSILLCSLMFNLICPLYSFAIEETDSSTGHIEHIKLSKKLAKKAPTNIIQITENGVDIREYNTLQVVFAEKFNSKTARVGDKVVFLFKEGVFTEEGTKIIPESTKLVAEISKIENPKAFNRCGKIYLDFKYIELPDGTQKEIEAKLFNKKDFLSRGKLNAMGKGFSTVFGTTAAGTAAGCGIGIAASSVIVGGLAIGLPIGFAVGGLAGLVTPGLHYKANPGDKIDIQLVENLNIDNNEK